MAGLISIALTIWGVMLSYIITFNVADSYPSQLGDSVLAYSQPTIWPDGHISACNITYVAPNIQSLTVQQLQNLTTHEVGHCLGLQHIPQDGSIMYFMLRDWTVFSGYDRAEFWRHYPAPTRIILGGLSHDPAN